MIDKPPRVIELDRDAVRPVFNGPLEKSRTLWLGMIFFGAMSLLGVWFAWYFDFWWSGAVIIPPAVIVGVAWAGLEPGFWFRSVAATTLSASPPMRAEAPARPEDHRAQG